MSPRIGHAAIIGLRIACALAGAYLFAWGATAFGAALLVLLGVARSEAVMVASMLSYIVYVAGGLWAFAEPRLVRVMLLLVAGGAAMLAASEQLARNAA